MATDASGIETSLVGRPLPAPLLPDQGWVAPDYEGLSIANLPATIASLLGMELPWTLAPLPRELWSDWAPGLRRIVLVTVDGLGYRQLKRGWAAGEAEPLRRLAEAGRLVPLTSVFPSTTAAALITLSTGVPPATHGWLGWEMYLREQGVAAKSVLLCPIWSRQRDLLIEWGLKPEQMMSVPTLAGRLTADGVSTRALVAWHLFDSAFARMLYRGVQRVEGHWSSSDFWSQLRSLLAETRGQQAFITAYWDGLDTLGHAYGPNAGSWQAEFWLLSHLLDREFVGSLPVADREGTLLLVTSDHGQILVPPAHVLVADEDPILTRGLLVPVMGEPRAAFLYPRQGRDGEIRSHLEEAFPSWFQVVESAKVLEGGLMGTPVADETYARAGVLLALPRADHALQRTKPRHPQLGRHGGLSAQEMLVPLIGARLEAAP